MWSMRQALEWLRSNVGRKVGLPLEDKGKIVLGRISKCGGKFCVASDWKFYPISATMLRGVRPLWVRDAGTVLILDLAHRGEIAPLARIPESEVLDYAFGLLEYYEDEELDFPTSIAIMYLAKKRIGWIAKFHKPDDAVTHYEACSFIVDEGEIKSMRGDVNLGKWLDMMPSTYLVAVVAKDEDGGWKVRKR